MIDVDGNKITGLKEGTAYVVATYEYCPDGTNVDATYTDTAKIVPVQYKGILPDLFAEGQGVVAQGKLDEQGVFCASEVLAKHDENYMPPEAAKALEDAHKAGVAKKQAEQAQAAKS